MTMEERRRPAVGGEVRRWRSERGLTLAGTHNMPANNLMLVFRRGAG